MAEWLHTHWQSEDDPVPYGYVNDTFSSDCSPSALIFIGWTPSELLVVTIFIS
jgi:hypothetical protein